MIDESWYRRPPGIPEHVSAGGVVVRVKDGGVSVALVQEGEHPQYVLPKGHVEEGEELAQAARREIQEECGLTSLTLRAALGLRERLDYRKASWKRTHYFLFMAEQVEAVPTTQGRHASVEWFPIDALPSMFWP